MSTQRRLILALIIAAGFVFSYLGKKLLHNGLPGSSAAPAGLTQGRHGPVKRIVSLAPSVTEVLFALGLGDKVIGVTRYCDYPPEASTRPQVGGYLDPNYEALLALRPDRVILLKENTAAAGVLQEMSLATLEVDQRNLAGILESISRIGDACGAGDRAAALRGDLERRMVRIRGRVEGLAQPRVMVVLGRNLVSGSLQGTYISGYDGFYSDLIELAGGCNAYTGRTVALPALSAEGVQQLDPQVILEMIPNLDSTRLDREELVRAWSFAAGVAAVRDRRVYVFGEDYVVRPGPRFIRLAEEMARAIHPELDWDSR